MYLLTLGNKELKLKEVKHESEFEWVWKRSPCSDKR